MLRLSKLADYAVVVLVRLSHGEAVQTSPGIALGTGVPEPTVAKVLKAAEPAGLSPDIAEPVWRLLIDRCIAHEFGTWDKTRV